MKKYDMAYIIVNSEVYEGDYNIKDLMKMTKDELESMYNEMLDAEYEYYI